MTNRRAAADFIDKCKAVEEVEQLRELFFSEVAAIGFPYVACCSHVDPLSPPPGAVSMINYPQAWLAHFSANRYASRDPVFWAAKRRITPFHWTDRAFRAELAGDQLTIPNEAAALGLKEGFTIPIHAPGALPASCSLVPGPVGADPLDYQLAHWMALHVHETARRLLLAETPSPVPVLSKRERECLELAGRGKEEWVIAELLGIALPTAHNTLERAKKRLGVATRTQAVLLAVQYGQIDLADLTD